MELQNARPSCKDNLRLNRLSHVLYIHVLDNHNLNVTDSNWVSCIIHLSWAPNKDIPLRGYVCIVLISAQLCLTFCDSRLLCPWDFWGKDTRVDLADLPNSGFESGILRLLHWQADPLPLNHLGNIYVDIRVKHTHNVPWYVKTASSDNCWDNYVFIEINTSSDNCWDNCVFIEINRDVQIYTHPFIQMCTHAHSRSFNFMELLPSATGIVFRMNELSGGRLTGRPLLYLIKIWFSCPLQWPFVIKTATTNNMFFSFLSLEKLQWEFEYTVKNAT